MFSILLILFIIVPILELYLLIELGQYIGAPNTILLVIITGLVGAILARLEGLRTWHNLQKELRHLKMPTDRIIDGVFILVGGVLLLTPGILTDILGFLFIIPFTRVVFRKYAKKRFSHKMKGNIKVINMRKS